MKARAGRNLVPFEIAAIVAVAIGWPHVSELVPASLPLVVVASVSYWLRGRSWGELGGGGGERVAVGAGAGAVGLVLAIVVGTPLVEALGGAVEWARHGMVRGNPTQLAVFAIWVGMAAFTAELVARGWVVERVLELSPGAPVMPILVGAVAEAALVSGSFGVRCGAALFGIGLGWMYVAGGRNIVAPVCARVVFVVGALLLDGLQIVG